MVTLNKQLLHIPTNGAMLEGILTIPKADHNIVIFAHGSGSSRHSKRNNFVAEVLNKSLIGTLLFDLLTPEEDLSYENRFDIELLTKRLKSATEWLIEYLKPKKDIKVGYFGASTGAAAAIEAACVLGTSISVIVSRGGRVDLAKDVLAYIKAPTLLIVGEYDDVVLDWNKEAYELINGKKKLSVIPKATHLFEEPGALEEVAKLACDWFKLFLIRNY